MGAYDTSGRTRCPPHTSKVFNPGTFPDLVESVSLRLLRLLDRVRFDAIAGSGNSGLLLLGAVSYRLGVPLIAVRRGVETTHDSRLVNGFFGGYERSGDDGPKPGSWRYLIIDDLIDTGKTMNRIINSIHVEEPHAVPVGILTYRTPYFSSDFSFKGEFGARVPTFHLTDPGLDSVTMTVVI